MLSWFIFLLFDGLFGFHLANKKGGSCHLFFLGCGHLARLGILNVKKLNF